MQPELVTAYRQARSKLVAQLRSVRQLLNPLRVALEQKRTKPASAADLSQLPTELEMTEAVDGTLSALADANAIIQKHNAIAADFQAHWVKAEEQIRQHFLAKCGAVLADHILTLKAAETAASNAKSGLALAVDEASRLREKLREHKPAADAINKLVKSYLGHDELSVHATDEGYEFHGHGKPIEGLPSEGEKTAIALAYFLSTIESDGRKLKDLVVVIDDPISSLDTKALNYACALLRSRLSKAKQLFIITHNQQCMNEFRKEWKSKAKPSDGNEPTATLLFMDVHLPEGASRRRTQIVPLSKLLREYDSEYHFLFQHVLRFAELGDAHSDTHT